MAHILLKHWLQNTNKHFGKISFPSAATLFTAKGRCHSRPRWMRTRTWPVSTSGWPAGRLTQTYCKSTSSPKSTSTSTERSTLSTACLWGSLRERYGATCRSPISLTHIKQDNASHKERSHCLRELWELLTVCTAKQCWNQPPPASVPV